MTGQGDTDLFLFVSFGRLVLVFVCGWLSPNMQGILKKSTMAHNKISYSFWDRAEKLTWSKPFIPVYLLNHECVWKTFKSYLVNV